MSKETFDLFAYGTLQPNESAWPMIKMYVKEYHRAEYNGILYNINDRFPAAYFGGVNDTIKGHVLQIGLKDKDSVLRVLDRYEGVPLLFVRVVLADGALAYQGCDPTFDNSAIIGSGDWLKETKRIQQWNYGG